MSLNKLTISEETTNAQQISLQSGKNSKVVQVSSGISSGSDSVAVKKKSKNFFNAIKNKVKTLTGSKQLDCGDEISSRLLNVETARNLNGSGENCSKSKTDLFKNVNENELNNQISNISIASEKTLNNIKSICEDFERLNAKDKEQTADLQSSTEDKKDQQSFTETTEKCDVLAPESRKRQQESSTEDESDSEETKPSLKADNIGFSKNLHNTNFNENINIPCDSAVTNRKQNSLFNCIMMIPIDCKGRIIGEKGIKIKEISRNCKARIHVDMEFIYYPWKEFRVNISGNPLQCKMAMRQILELIRQVDFHQQYPLKIYVDSIYMAGIIGKKGQFVQQIRLVSGADLVKVFSTWPDNEKNGVLVIKHCSIYHCIKAAGMTLNKLRTMQIFQLNNSIKNATYYYHIKNKPTI